MLEANDADLHSNGGTVNSISDNEFLFCSNNEGRVPGNLCVVFRWAAVHWRADAQYIEGVMSMIKICIERASDQMTLRHLDSQIGIVRGVDVADSSHRKGQ